MEEQTAKQTKKPTVFVMIGISGVGKSYIGGELAYEYDAEFLEADAIRLELKLVNSTTNVNRVLELMDERLLEALNDGRNVVYDAIHIRRATRKGLIELIRAYHPEAFIVGIEVSAPLRVCLERKRYRQGQDTTMRDLRSMYSAYEEVSREEGFDDILRVDNCRNDD